MRVPSTSNSNIVSATGVAMVAVDPVGNLTENCKFWLKKVSHLKNTQNKKKHSLCPMDSQDSN